MVEQTTNHTEHRRGALTLLLRPTPFTLRLERCTVSEVTARAATAEVPRNFGLRTKDGELILRNYGSGTFSTGWSVRARMEQSGDGVRLTGRLRYLLDRIRTGIFTVFTAFIVVVVIGLGLSKGPGSEDFIGALVVGSILVLVTVLLLAMLPGTVARQQARAREILRDTLEGA